MKQCKKDVEVTLDDGTVIEAVLKVTEFVDEGIIGDAISKVGSWSTKHDEELDDDQQAEFDEKIEEMVFDEKWNWDEAADTEDDEDELDEEQE